MKIVCPHCNYAREVPAAQVPDRPVRVTCPKCQQGFAFDKAASGAEADFTTAPAADPSDPAATVCPACHLEQPAGTVCGGCGVVYAKWAERQASRQQAGSAVPPRAEAEAEFPGRAAYVAALPADRPKAGFWIRAVAVMIDGLILGAVQFVVGLVLGMVGGAAGGFDGEESLALLALTWLCSMVISFTYYIFFTGYNGQTPGKMALRIQVVRTDGTPMSYGRAFLREIPCKFISGILFGIGYLMVAFDQQKQGLHDRMAGTYVVRL